MAGLMMMSDNVDQMLVQATNYARGGNTQQARQLLVQLLREAPHSERAWLLMAYTAVTVEEKRAALWHALTINPLSARTLHALTHLLEPHYTREAAQSGVFISYAPADDVFAIQLAEDLRFFGVKVWLDILDMADGSDWFEAIEAAVQRCGVMLLIGSPAAVRTENVFNEFQRFMEAGKVVVPVQYQACDLTSLGLLFPPLDFSEEYSSGLQDVLRLLTAPAVARSGR